MANIITDLKYTLVLIPLLFSLFLNAEVNLRVHKVGTEPDGSGQYMEVFIDGEFFKSYWISTGNPKKIQRNSWLNNNTIKGTETPEGRFIIQSISRKHLSTQSKLKTPLNYFMPFKGNFAIHQTTQPNDLGKKSTLGCIGLAEEDAKELYDLVASTKYSEQKIVEPFLWGDPYLQTIQKFQASVEILNDATSGITPLAEAPYKENVRSNNSRVPSINGIDNQESDFGNK